MLETNNSMLKSETMEITERVAKLEQRVGDGFLHINEQLKEIKDNHLSHLRVAVENLQQKRERDYLDIIQRLNKNSNKIDNLYLRVSFIVGALTIAIDLTMRWFFK